MRQAPSGANSRVHQVLNQRHREEAATYRSAHGGQRVGQIGRLSPPFHCLSPSFYLLFTTARRPLTSRVFKGAPESIMRPRHWYSGESATVTLEWSSAPAPMSSSCVNVSKAYIPPTPAVALIVVGLFG